MCKSASVKATTQQNIVEKPRPHWEEIPEHEPEAITWRTWKKELYPSEPYLPAGEEWDEIAWFDDVA